MAIVPYLGYTVYSKHFVSHTKRALCHLFKAECLIVDKLN